jgi:hypothetical protein
MHIRRTPGAVQYRRLRVALPLLSLGWLLFGVVLNAVFHLFDWGWHIAMIIPLACIPVMAGGSPKPLGTKGAGRLAQTTNPGTNGVGPHVEFYVWGF